MLAGSMVAPIIPSTKLFLGSARLGSLKCYPLVAPVTLSELELGH